MKKQALTPAERNRRWRKKKKASMSATEQVQYNQNRVKSESSRRKRKVASMSASEHKQYKEKLARSEASRKKRKVAPMTEFEQNQYLEEQWAKRKARNDERKKDKQDNPKGYILNEVD